MFYMSRLSEAATGKRPRYWVGKEGVLPSPPKTVYLSKKEVGQRLRTIRIGRGVSQVELAKALGTYQTTISAIERGVRGLTLQQAVRLADALGASPDDILGARKEGKDSVRLNDRRFVRRLEKITRLPKRDQQALLRTIDAFLAKVS